MTLADEERLGDHERDAHSRLPARPVEPDLQQGAGDEALPAIMAKYDPKGNANDGLNLYGVAKAWTS